MERIDAAARKILTRVIELTHDGRGLPEKDIATIILTEMKVEVSEYTIKQASLLIYFHYCAINGGYVESRRMDAEEHCLAKTFEEEGLIRFRRLKMREIEKLTTKASHKVMLTDAGFDLANHYHKERQARMLKDRPYEVQDEE